MDILFSLQKHLSASLTRTGDSKQPPQFHVSHFRRIVSALLLCPPSARGTRTKKRKTDRDDDRTLDAGVRDHFVNTWFSVHDDVRWFFLRDAAFVGFPSPSMPAHSHNLYPGFSSPNTRTPRHPSCPETCSPS